MRIGICKFIPAMLSSSHGAYSHSAHAGFFLDGQLWTGICKYSGQSKFSKFLHASPCNTSDKPSVATSASKRQKVPPVQHPITTRNVLVAVDPDTRGAIAVANWSHEAHSIKGSKDSRGEDDENGETVDFAQIEFKVFDMPCATVTLASKKSKVTGKAAVRRVVDPHAARKLIFQSIATQTPAKHVVGTPSPGLRLQAYIEAPPIIPSDSALATATLSYTNGMWHGLLTMGGFQAGSIPARVWKKDMGLWKLDKDASRQLAAKIFPQMKDLLILKKHHGRAEALLMAAWALGVRVDKENKEVSHGPMRRCTSTDAYGNAVNYSLAGHVAGSHAGPFQEDGCTPQAVYADAKTLHEIKAAEEQAREARKGEKAKRLKEARKAQRRKTRIAADIEALESEATADAEAVREDAEKAGVANVGVMHKAEAPAARVAVSTVKKAQHQVARSVITSCETEATVVAVSGSTEVQSSSTCTSDEVAAHAAKVSEATAASPAARTTQHSHVPTSVEAAGHATLADAQALVKEAKKAQRKKARRPAEAVAV